MMFKVIVHVNIWSLGLVVTCIVIIDHKSKWKRKIFWYNIYAKFAMIVWVTKCKKLQFGLFLQLNLFGDQWTNLHFVINSTKMS